MNMRFFGLIAIFVALLLVNACDRQKQVEPSGHSVKIGVLLPEHDPQMSREGLIGINIIRQKKPLLLNGDKIELIVKYVEQQPQQARAVLKGMLEQDNVLAVLIFSSSDELIAMSHLADTFKTPFIALNATHPEVTKNRAYVNQLVFDDKFQGTVAALFVRDDLLVDKVAVIYDDKSVSSKFLSTEFIKKFIAVNGKVSSVQTWPKKNEAVAAMLKKSMQFNPDLLYLPLQAEKVFKIATLLQDYSYQPMLMGADGLITDVLLSNPEKEILDGLMATDFFADDVALTPFGNLVKERYTFYHDRLLLSFAPLGAEGFAMLYQAMNRCLQTLNRECINNRLRDEHGLEGIMGVVQIKVDGKARRPLVVNRIVDGEAEFLVKVY